jgi:ubiquinone/menaquinone biosynthesis C-methylase UbiE
MGFYHDAVLPRLIDCVCGLGEIEKLRRKVVPQARGRVLDVGVGSGLNLAFYDAARVERVIGVDPAPGALALARRRAAAAAFPVELLPVEAARVPLAAASVDTVVVTFTLCTVPDPAAALAETRRVLKPGGRLLFCEHGRAPDEGVRRWQRRINPLWSRLFGGCNLDREIPRLIEAAGYRTGALEAAYLAAAPRFVGYAYAGWAAPA